MMVQSKILMKKANEKFPKLILTELVILAFLVVTLFVSISDFQKTKSNSDFSDDNKEVADQDVSLNLKNTTVISIPESSNESDDLDNTKTTVFELHDKNIEDSTLTLSGTSTLVEDETLLCVDSTFDNGGDAIFETEDDVREYIDSNYSVDYDYLIVALDIDDIVIWEVNLGEEKMYFGKNGIQLQLIECVK
jgi:hypothetical protein